MSEKEENQAGGWCWELICRVSIDQVIKISGCPDEYQRLEVSARSAGKDFLTTDVIERLFKSSSRQGKSTLISKGSYYFFIARLV